MSEFTREEVDSIYVLPSERYVVSLIVGYSESDLRDDDPDAWVELSSEGQAREAARWALKLTTDEGSSGTVWCVYDRQEQVSWQFEQGELEDGDDGL